MTMIPDRTSMRSNSGQLRRNSACSSSVQKPMTHSTLERLYQLTVEEHHLAGGREVFDIALEVPLGLLALGRLGEGDDADGAGRGALGDALDDTALAGGAAAFEDDQDLQTLLLNPVLQEH
jgi:hypothetical protein